jgi:hypothetical protein
MKVTNRPMVCRVNAASGGAHIGLVQDEHWHRHPTLTCDVAVAPFSFSRDTFSVLGIDMSEGILTKDYIEAHDIGCGCEVFTAGLLVNHFGRERNIPVIRTGYIAAMPEESVNLGSRFGTQEVYLIESRSIGGLSGSPVFLNTPPVSFVNNKIRFADKIYSDYLIGINIGLFETDARADITAPDTEVRRAAFLETISAGISVVVPIQRVIEIMESEPLKTQRDEAYERHFGLGKRSSAPLHWDGRVRSVFSIRAAFRRPLGLLSVDAGTAEAPAGA